MPVQPDKYFSLHRVREGVSIVFSILAVFTFKERLSNAFDAHRSSLLPDAL